MSTRAGSPEPQTRYCTWMPSRAIAICAAPSAFTVGSTGAVAAAGGAGAGSFEQAPRSAARSAGARTRESCCMKRLVLDERGDMIADRERRGEPGALYPQEIHEPGKSVVPRSFDAKVRLGFTVAVQLGADAGVVRHECAVGKRGPV